MLTCLTDREIEFSELRFIIINIIVVCMCVWSDRAITDAVMHCKGYRTKSKPPRKKNVANSVIIIVERLRVVA